MPPKIKRMNKGAYLAFFIVMLMLNLGSTLVCLVVALREHELEYLLYVLIVWYVLLPTTAVGLVLFHYRMWAAIYEDGMKISGTKIDPVAAAVLLLVSFVGEYWNFRFYSEFVNRYNENIKSYGDELQPLPTVGSAFKTVPVLRVVLLVLCITVFITFYSLALVWLVAVITHVVFLAVVWRTCDAVNVLADAMGAGGGTAP